MEAFSTAVPVIPPPEENERPNTQDLTQAPREGEKTMDEAPQKFRTLFEQNPELDHAWKDARAFREIQQIFPTAEDARNARARLADFDRLDALFFSNRPESHAQLAAFVHQLSPEAFHSLANAMAQVSQQAQRQGSTEPKNSSSSPASASLDSAASSVSAFHGANASAVQGVVSAIEQQADRLLPENVSAGARNRIVGEIYRELQTALGSNRPLAEQLRQAFVSGNGSEEHQKAVAGLIVSRAKQLLPGIARKVIEEWTSGVLAVSQARRARSEAGERRVDIAGGAAAAGGRRPLSPRDVDYSRMSDADILNL